MVQTITALTERLSALSNDAHGLRSKAHAQPVDMIRLAKILAQKAQIELQLKEQGVCFAIEEVATLPESDWPF